RQEQRDAIAAPDAAGSERVGEAVRGLAQRAVAHLFHRAVGAKVENGSARRIDLGPAVTDVDADIVTRRDLPAERAVERAIVARGRKDMARGHRSGGWSCPCRRSSALRPPRSGSALAFLGLEARVRPAGTNGRFDCNPLDPGRVPLQWRDLPPYRVRRCTMDEVATKSPMKPEE